jgi:protein TonB
MSTDGRPRSPQSWEHLLEKDPHGGRRFRIGIMAAMLIHAGIFAVTWPTVAQAPPDEPEEVLYRVPIYDFVPRQREPEPIVEIELPKPPSHATVIVPGPPPEESTEPIERDAFEPPEGPVVVIELPDPPPPPPDPPPTIVTADFEIAAPTIEYRVEPRYTEPARRAGIEGVVILELIIDTEGRVESVNALRGLPLGLTKSAIDAVKQWQFEASTYKGNPVSVRYILTINFNLR